MSKPYIIGITGGSGSGKTFFLKCFLEHFHPDDICLISQDDYYLYVSDHMTREENKLYNFDLPETIDRKQFDKDIKRLIDGEVVSKKEYTFHNASAVGKMLHIKPAPVLIIEGLFILYFREIDELLDHKIFIEADDEVALQRRLARDLTERGYSHEEVSYKWINHVKPAYREFLLPYKNECDRVIDNNTNSADNMVRVAKEIADFVISK